MKRRSAETSNGETKINLGQRESDGGGFAQDPRRWNSSDLDTFQKETSA
jgi:hypothetical protein